MESVWMRLPLLGMMFFLAGCSPTTTTLTAATNLIGNSQAMQTDTRLAADACRAWKPVTYSSRDTGQTQLEARASNAAREAYCAKGPGQ